MIPTRLPKNSGKIKVSGWITVTVIGFIICTYIVTAYFLVPILVAQTEGSIWVLISYWVILFCPFGRISVWIYEEFLNQRAKYHIVTLQTIKVSLFAIFFISLIFLSSHVAIWLYVLITIVMITLYGVSIIIAFSIRNIPDWLVRVVAKVSHFWNLNKAFGGGVFGDVANTIGILSSIALVVSNAGDGWFWIGQFAALLAILVGLSQVQRWLLEEKFSPWGMGYAFGNFAVGAFTFLSITCLTESSPHWANELLRNLGLKIPQTIILLLVLGIIISFWFSRNTGQSQLTKDYTSFKVFLFFFTLLTLGSMISLWIFQFFIVPTYLPAIFAILAMISWMFIELFTLIENRAHVLVILRSIFIICGNLVLLPLVVRSTWIAGYISNQYDQERWILYTIGIVLMSIATIFGILLSAHHVAKKHVELRLAEIEATARRIYPQVAIQAAQEARRKAALTAPPLPPASPQVTLPPTEQQTK